MHSIFDPPANARRDSLQVCRDWAVVAIERRLIVVEGGKVRADGYFTGTALDKPRDILGSGQFARPGQRSYKVALAQFVGASVKHCSGVEKEPVEREPVSRIPDCSRHCAARFCHTDQLPDGEASFLAQTARPAANRLDRIRRPETLEPSSRPLQSQFGGPLSMQRRGRCARERYRCRQSAPLLYVAVARR